MVVVGRASSVSTALTLLERQPGLSLLLLEKEHEVARHQTGHNSGVIHAGVYYAPGSLKARLCTAGARATRDFCDAHGITYRDTGKLIVATDAAELRRREPNVTGVGALFSPSSGTVDFTEVCRAMAGEVERLGGQLRLGAEVSDITESLSEVRVDLRESGEPAEPVFGRRLVVCGGVQADRLLTGWPRWRGSTAGCTWCRSGGSTTGSRSRAKTSSAR